MSLQAEAEEQALETERRIHALEEALMETRLELRELRGYIAALKEAGNLTARGGLKTLERLSRVEARLGMEP